MSLEYAGGGNVAMRRSELVEESKIVESNSFASDIIHEEQMCDSTSESTFIGVSSDDDPVSSPEFSFSSYSSTSCCLDTADTETLSENVALDLTTSIPTHLLSLCFRMVPTTMRLQLRLVCSRWCQILSCVVIDLRPPPQLVPHSSVPRNSWNTDLRVHPGMFRKSRPLTPLQLDQKGQLHICFYNSHVLVTMWKHISGLFLQPCSHMHSGISLANQRKCIEDNHWEDQKILPEEKVVKLLLAQKGNKRKCLLAPPCKVQAAVSLLQFLGIHIPHKTLSAIAKMQKPSTGVHAEQGYRPTEAKDLLLCSVGAASEIKKNCGGNHCNVSEFDTPVPLHEVESRIDAQLRILGSRIWLKLSGPRAMQFQNAIRRLQPNQRMWLSNQNNWMLQRDALPNFLALLKEENLAIAPNPQLTIMLQDIEDDTQLAMR
mmetsp:Transcript_36024/g.50027  ORF Transcript_36024/g.50027 Transcript_36024/m.50027 type:complete len:430 (+) Transcript_36024:3-1292(+)